MTDMLDAVKAIEETDKGQDEEPSRDAVAENEEERRDGKDKPTIQDEKTTEKSGGQ